MPTSSRIFAALLFLGALLPTVHSVTDFVGDDEFIVGQSFKPCHLFGDSDIIGPGVRTAFYLQFIAALLVIVVRLRDEPIILRQGFAVLASAILVSIYTNSLGKGLYVLDWIIIMPLALLLPTFTIAFPNIMGLGYQIYRVYEFSHHRRISSMERAMSSSTGTGSDVASTSVNVETGQGEQDGGATAKLAKLKRERRRYKKIMKAFEDDDSGNTEVIIGYGPISMGMFLCTHSAYLLTQIKVHWKDNNVGRKSGCDIRIIPFVFSTLLYDKHTLAYLRAISIMLSPFGILFSILGMIFIVYGMVRSWKKEMEKDSKKKGKEKADPPTSGEPKDNVRIAVDEVQLDNDENIEGTVKSWKNRSRQFRIGWLFLFGIPAFISIVILTELTIWINHIDMVGAPFSSTSQLLAFTAGLGVSVPVFWAACIKLHQMRNEIWEWCIKT